MGKIISIVNQKGGVGKTITAINLSTALAATEKKVLLIDADPQGNATTGFAINKEEDRNLYTVLVNDDLTEDVVVNSGIRFLDILVSNIDLAAAEMELVNIPSFRYRLKKKLASIKSQYDYIIIDCPPSLGLLTINSLTASDSVIIPLQCEFFALEGLKHLMETIKMIKANLNANLDIDGVVLTMYDKRNNLTDQVEEDVRNCLGELVYKTVIPRNVRISEASSYGEPAIVYDMHCAGSKAYLDMAKEFLEREKIRTEEKL
ncbi:MAG: ParA family protein [Alphaproteobacteria bacterium]|nr:ParA family protein [Alphaproteobacteria bacterium]